MNDLDNLFTGLIPEIYGCEDEILSYQIDRYKSLINKFVDKFGYTAVSLFSAPGRTELGGNHTDHNNGRVLAAAINYDIIAAVSPTSDNTVKIYSEGYPDPFTIDLSEVAKQECEFETTSGLIRGIASGLQSNGYDFGGFSACISSDILAGSGLSSSAAVEVLIGTVFNILYNQGKIGPEVIARIGQYAENEYFGKPCGLMDQISSILGGIVAIDFKNPLYPEIRKIDFNLKDQNYCIMVVNTGDNHLDLNDEYTSIPVEMGAIAHYFNESVLRELSIKTILENLNDLRTNHGDRAVLRALHYFAENERVSEKITALEQKQFEKFLGLIDASGNSSFKWLQNVYSSKNVTEQSISIALALTELFNKNTGYGACRVHGGGFAGTIQVFLPNDKIKEYKSFIEPVFGRGCVLELRIRDAGTIFLGEYSSDRIKNILSNEKSGRLIATLK